MPFTCRYCGQPHCSMHRLPENHECRGLEDYKEQLRDRGQLMAETPQVKVQREIRDEPSAQRSRRRGVRSQQVLQAFEGRMTWILLGTMLAVTVLAQMARFGAGRAAFVAHFTLTTSSYLRPWTLLSSIFAHAGVAHLLLNGLVLFFFGPAVERRIGTRALIALFLATGAVAGIAQVAVAAAVGSAAPVLGASGAILAVLGVMTILEPDATVLLFFVIPMPLWMVTAGFAVVDFVTMLSTGFGGGVANLAHLVGLGLGLAAAKLWWDRPRRRTVETWGM